MINRARTSILGRIPGTDVFESIDICETVKINVLFFEIEKIIKKCLFA